MFLAMDSNNMSAIGYVTIGSLCYLHAVLLSHLGDDFTDIVSMGLGIGTLASGVASPWPDILLTAAVIVFQVVVPAAMLPALMRRAATSGSA